MLARRFLWIVAGLVMLVVAGALAYRLFEEQDPAPKKLSYSDNFRTGRPQPWTH